MTDKEHSQPVLNPVAKLMSDLMDVIDSSSTIKKYGRVLSARGQVIEVAYEGLKIGEICIINNAGENGHIRAEVVSVEEGKAILCPLEPSLNVSSNLEVFKQETELSLKIGDWLLGGVVDGFGNPIDIIHTNTDNSTLIPIKGTKISPMDRPIITEVLEMGIPVIDASLTLGCGQRVCLLGAAGTGKSTLIASLARNCDARIIVIGLVGERGREVREFLDRLLPSEMRSKIIVVVATSDRPAMERFYAAHTASTIAEYFRDQGHSVLLVVDSLTRVARALREIGLAMGELPTRRGYPASVYPALPELIERGGRTKKGDITAIYSVLAEGEQEEDPIVEEVKSLTDGHIVLSRKIAESGRYPAIDTLKSVSRIMQEIAEEEHISAAKHIRKLLSKFKEIELLVQVGEYKSGVDPIADEAINKVPKINTLFSRGNKEAVPFSETVAALKDLVSLSVPSVNENTQDPNIDTFLSDLKGEGDDMSALLSEELEKILESDPSIREDVEAMLSEVRSIK